jgi:hypothetical protein
MDDPLVHRRNPNHRAFRERGDDALKLGVEVGARVLLLTRRAAGSFARRLDLTAEDRIGTVVGQFPETDCWHVALDRPTQEGACLLHCLPSDLLVLG